MGQHRNFRCLSLFFTRATSQTNMLAYSLGDCRDNQRNSQSVFRLVAKYPVRCISGALPRIAKRAAENLLTTDISLGKERLRQVELVPRCEVSGEMRRTESVPCVVMRFIGLDHETIKVDAGRKYF